MGEGLTSISPRDNIWVTITNKTNQSSICLALGGVGNPFRTCLVGVPTWRVEDFVGLMNESLNYTGLNNSIGHAGGSTPQQHDGAVQCALIYRLNTTLHSDPEELDLFGSTNASTPKSAGDYVEFEPLKERQLNVHRKLWASLDSSLKTSSVYEFVYSRCNGSNITNPLRLPEGIFLICGDRAWNGIPRLPTGGPCYLGRLTLFHPNISTLMRLMNDTGRVRRSLHELDCADVGPPKF